jgi:cobalt-zinc-cadmium efflux system membrane fusion protein
MKTAVLAVIFVFAACGHSHDHDDKHDHAGADAELPGQSVTIWAKRTELFMEYQPLVVGKETRFAAHVTEMPSFEAVTAGSTTVTVKLGDTALVAKADAPANPGIFRPAITPTKAGPCELVVSVTSPQVSEEFSAGPCQVFASEADARTALGDATETPGRISYLKEQQWKTDFALALVGKRDMQDGVRANGEIRPVAGREARVAAPISGRVELASPTPLLGTTVKAGTVLATITPRATSGDRSTLTSDVTALQAEVHAARTELSRAERLVAAQAAPARTVEEARTRVQVAEARLAGATGRLSQFDASASGGAGGGRRFQLRAPMDGVLVSIDVATGENVEEGTSLFGVIDLDRVWLVAQVFEPDVPRIEKARLAWFTIEGYATPFTVDETTGKLVTIGRVIDPKTRTASVIFEVTNVDGRLRIGNFTKVVIATGAPRNVLAIPESALVDDAGKSVAYVMVEGEAFERRPIRLGIRANGWVEVLDGVVEGERVVSTGAYEIRLSAATGSVPAHGHAH